jgi:hypothetical protein
VVGPRAIRRNFAAQLAAFRQEAQAALRGAPVIMGEIGIPFDLQGGRAYRTGDFRTQAAAADRTLVALEDALLSFTWWNYTPDNDNIHGDQWNGEDLSIFSRSQQRDPHDINAGGRALDAIVRPYARAIAGEPLAMHFDRQRGTFTLRFRHDPTVTEPTEIFLPATQYPRGVRVTVSDGTFDLDATAALLRYHHSTDRAEHTVIVRRT